MRVKNNSLIVLGIGIGLSSFILSGCTTGSGGFLNLGIVDALQKSKACVFKEKLGYKKPLASAGKFSLPSIGNRPSTAGQPVAVQNYSVQTQGDPFPTSDCGCAASEDEQYYMPTRAPHTDVLKMSPGELVEPPINFVPSRQIDDAQLPDINPLPAEITTPDLDGSLNDADTEGTFEPISKSDDLAFPQDDQPSAALAPAENNLPQDDRSDLNQPEVVDQNRDSQQSIFEAAKTMQHRHPNFDSMTQKATPAPPVAEPKAPKIVVLHARPAQSHNVFTRQQQEQKSLEAMQASHRMSFRRQNSLRNHQYNDGAYRQAMNTDEVIDFKPLPPIKEELPVRSTPTPTPTLTPTPTQSAPLPLQNEFVPTANSSGSVMGHRTASRPNRTPILRATTASSASILSLKNLANVISDQRTAESDSSDRNSGTSLK